MREIGTLSALGMHGSELTRLFLLEGTFISAIGAAIGTAVGIILTLYLGRVGIDFYGCNVGHGFRDIINNASCPEHSKNHICILLFGSDSESRDPHSVEESFANSNLLKHCGIYRHKSPLQRPSIFLKERQMKYKIIISLILIMIIPSLAFAITGEEIIRNADNAVTFDTAESAGEMRITDRFGTKVTTFKSWARGEDDSLIEFTSRAERGQKVLRTKDEIFLFYPDAEELIRMQGSALRQGMLGSDISYEDMTGGKDRASQYIIKITAGRIRPGQKLLGPYPRCQNTHCSLPQRDCLDR